MSTVRGWGWSPSTRSNSTSTAQNGSFIVNEFYRGFAFDNGLRFRAGSVVVPLTPLRGITNYGGLTFPDVSDTALPFLRGLGSARMYMDRW
jgi:hypothetical protein